jgi:hypothetical protein
MSGYVVRWIGTNVSEEPAAFFVRVEDVSSETLVPIYQTIRYHIPGDILKFQEGW